ncbi:MAG: hypothetical protein P4L85_25405 [Paludisphaera borealis]|uniref:hypothetical protein n=1 Tax=Paludisphaera borealis TaxID=1387353 RepID=UPI00283CD37C|nr:hypothetical protein [Paludisphaera borealis]MDR3622715.1 hypothetical protein [Paludisphaera borealis]
MSLRTKRALALVVALGMTPLFGVLVGAGEPPASLKVPGIENVFRLSPTLYSGGQPNGAESFAALKAMGVKTILTVDGAAPDVEAARKLGLRYVHLPVGYDGIPREQALKIIQAVRTLPGPVFVHCHHGKHRGPAAAALCGIAVEGWSNGDAASWLKQAGTSPDYRGLYATVADFQPPSPAELEKLGTDFPERAQAPALVELMVAIDGDWDRMKAIRDAGYKPPASHPDVDPPHEALQLAEQFQEMARKAETKRRGADLVGRSEAAARLASDFEAALRRHGDSPNEATRKKLDDGFVAIGRSCIDCHARHRDEKSK